MANLAGFKLTDQIASQCETLALCGIDIAIDADAQCIGWLRTRRSKARRVKVLIQLVIIAVRRGDAGFQIVIYLMLQNTAQQMGFQLCGVQISVTEHDVFESAHWLTIGTCRDAAIDEPLMIDVLVRQIQRRVWR